MHHIDILEQLPCNIPCEAVNFVNGWRLNSLQQNRTGDPEIKGVINTNESLGIKNIIKTIIKRKTCKHIDVSIQKHIFIRKVDKSYLNRVKYISATGNWIELKWENPPTTCIEISQLNNIGAHKSTFIVDQVHLEPLERTIQDESFLKKQATSKGAMNNGLRGRKLIKKVSCK